MSSQDALKRAPYAPDGSMEGKPVAKSFPEFVQRQLHGPLVVEARAVTSSGHVIESGLRAQPAVERYKRRGQLTLRQVRAAELLYRAWALGVEGARTGDAASSAWTPGGMGDAQVQAVRAYETARINVGPRLWPLVFHVCCLDWTADRFARERGGRNPTSTLEVLRYGLDSLADSFGIPE